MKHKLIILSAILFLIPITAFTEDWTPMNSGTNESLYGVWGISGTDVFSAGYYDAMNLGLHSNILHFNGIAWTNSNWTGCFYPCGDFFYNIWGSSSTNLFAVGGWGAKPSLCPEELICSGGLIAQYDGNQWHSYNRGQLDWFDIWGSSSTDVFAVGGGGNILHYDGITWSPMTSGTVQYLHGVWGSSGTDVFAVGGGGTILHYNGSSWSSMASGTTIGLLDIWGSSSTDVFAVGGNGTILHYNGSSWSSMTSGITTALSGVWGSSGTDVFAVGGGGTILHYHGSSWSSMASGTTNTLRECWGSSSTDVFAVGDSGTILHYGGAVTTTTTTTAPATLINLASFTATPKFSKVIIQWSTEAEIDNAGFNIYRAESENGEYTQINTSLIPAQGFPTQSAFYEYIDNDVKNRKTYYYKLEDIDLNGSSTMHGPKSATPRWFLGIFGREAGVNVYLF